MVDKNKRKLSRIVKSGVPVKVIAGNDKGSVGLVTKVVRNGDSVKVIVRGVSISQRILKDKDGTKSFIHEERLIDLSNVTLFVSLD